MIDEYEEDELEDESIEESNENFCGLSLEQESEPTEDLIETDPKPTIKFEKEVTEPGSKIIDEIEIEGSQVLAIKETPRIESDLKVELEKVETCCPGGYPRGR